MTARRWLSGALAALCVAAVALPSTAGTVRAYRVRNTMQPGSADDEIWCPPHIAVAGGHVWFTAFNEEDGFALWRSDGTPAGTAAVKSFGSEIWVSGLAPAETTGLGDGVLFAASDWVHGRELWRSDGTVEGTAMVKEIWPGKGMGYETFLYGPSDLASLNEAVVFSVVVDSSTFPARSVPWVSDGTEAGTLKLADVLPDRIGEWDRPFTSLGARAVFFSGAQVWATDGTPAGTGVIAELPLPPTWGGVVAGGAYTFLDGTEIWRTDGTAAGTRMLLDLGSDLPDILTIVASTAEGFFFLREWSEPNAFRHELWFSDFEGADPRIVYSYASEESDPMQGCGNPCNCFYGVTAADLYFRGRPRNELWASDGTAAGTREVVDLDTLGISQITRIRGTRLGDLLLFEGTAAGTSSGQERGTTWCTDGTAAGLWPLGVHLPTWGSPGDGPVYLDGRVYFMGRTPDPPTLGLWAVARVGVSVTAVGEAVTDELGGAATLSVVLESKPLRAVTVPVASSDPGEAGVWPAALTFTPEDWDVPQLVAVTGRPDGVVDSDAAYTVRVGPASSADPAYDALDGAEVSLVNLDGGARVLRRRLLRGPAPRR